jgi:molecular chaperone GrpE
LEATENNKAIEPDAESEVERLKEELNREHEMYLRTLADFDNYRQRVDRERAATAQRAKREVLLPWLEVLDDLALAFRHLDDVPSSISEGLQAIHRKLLGFLEAQGIAPFDSIGQPFDPTWHDAVGSVRSDKYESGTVVEEVRQGYRMGDELLRPARVRVMQ